MDKSVGLTLTLLTVGGGESGRSGILPASVPPYLPQPILYQETDNYNNIHLQRIGKLQNEQLIQSLLVSKLAGFGPYPISGSISDPRQQLIRTHVDPKPARPPNGAPLNSNALHSSTPSGLGINGAWDTIDSSLGESRSA